MNENMDLLIYGDILEYEIVLIEKCREIQLKKLLKKKIKI